MMQVKIIHRVLLVCIFFSFQYSVAQIHSVHVYGTWAGAVSSGLSMNSNIREDIQVNRAAGWGGGIDVQYSLTDDFQCMLSAGYQYYAINQETALERWGWKFWETRYKGNVRDILNSDTTVKAQLLPKESMESYPVFLSGVYSLYKPEKFTLSVYAGLGVIFYYRKFMLEEQWQKYYPSEQYTFTYSFRNFAPTKAGNPLAALTGASCVYQFSDGFGVQTAVSYIHVINTGKAMGYENFPFCRALQAKLGLTIFY